MANYRCYCLDRHGCIRAVTAIAAETDEGARACSALLLATCAHESAEIWDGRRRVGVVERSAAHGLGEAARPVPATPVLRSNPRPGPAAPAPRPAQQWNRIDPTLG